MLTYLYSKDILVDESGNILVDESGNTLTAIRADLQWVYQVNVPPLDLNVVVPIGANAYAYLYSKDILVDESGNILVDESGNTLTAIRADLQWVYQVNVPPPDLSVTVEEAT